MRLLTHIVLYCAAMLSLIGCNIYSNVGEADGCVAQNTMRVTFNISSGNPEFQQTKASSYGPPSLENGTEWELKWFAIPFSSGPHSVSVVG